LTGLVDPARNLFDGCEALAINDPQPPRRLANLLDAISTVDEVGDALSAERASS